MRRSVLRQGIPTAAEIERLRAMDAGEQGEWRKQNPGRVHHVNYAVAEAEAPGSGVRGAEYASPLAKCVYGQDEVARAGIEAALALTATVGEPAAMAETSHRTSHRTARRQPV